VSYFDGKSSNAYARRNDITMLCKMSEHQKKEYMKAIGGENSKYSKTFFIGPRVVSNFVLPSNIRHLRDDMGKYSCKFSKCIDHLVKTKKQAFVYSNFVSIGGTDQFIMCLKAKGFSTKQYGNFVSGNEKHNIKVVDDFNAGKIQVIIGSPAMKEGVSLKNCTEVHLLDPYWNKSITEQIIGRALRFCSHIDLSKKNRVVNVYHYAATTPKIRTVDQYIMHLSEMKHMVTSKFEALLKEASVDCSLFHRKNCFERNNVAIKTFQKLYSSKKYKGISRKKGQAKALVFKKIPVVKYSRIHSSIKKASVKNV
jgi:hypothetical protein